MKKKEQDKQIVEVHIYVHIEGVPSYTTPPNNLPNTYYPPYTTYCGTSYTAGTERKI